MSGIERGILLHACVFDCLRCFRSPVHPFIQIISLSVSRPKFTTSSASVVLSISIPLLLLSVLIFVFSSLILSFPESMQTLVNN